MSTELTGTYKPFNSSKPHGTFPTCDVSGLPCPPRTLDASPPTIDEAGYEAVEFECEGSIVRAWLWKPPNPVASVVLGHGLSAGKDFGLQVNARNLASYGIAALAIDFRGIGSSDAIQGRPLQFIDFGAQARDYAVAAKHLRESLVPGAPVFLWGDSSACSAAVVAAQAMQEAGRPAHGVILQAPSGLMYNIHCVGVGDGVIGDEGGLARMWYLTRSLCKEALALLFCYTCCKPIYVRAFATAPDMAESVVQDSFGIWPFVSFTVERGSVGNVEAEGLRHPKGGGWDNTIPVSCIPGMVLFLTTKPKAACKAVEAPVFVIHNANDMRSGTSERNIRLAFAKKRGSEMELVTHPHAEHMSVLPLVNLHAYERDARDYAPEIRAAHRGGKGGAFNMFYPDVYPWCFSQFCSWILRTAKQD